MIIPDNETSVDFLNCETISKTVAEVLSQNRNRAITLGIHGDWGAGKSSILKMIEQELGADKSVACLWFNGWTFQGFDNAKTVLIEAIISELMRQRTGMSKVQTLGNELLRRVDWIKLARKGAGLAWNLTTAMPSPDQIGLAIDSIKRAINGLGDQTADDISEQLKTASSFLKPAEGSNLPEAINDFRERFRELLDEAKVDQLVVLIDDLDRCLPETAIETLEAIRLFLFVPKAAFVIGADEGMIEYAVRRHFPDLPVSPTSVPYARNYLEKLIQIPLRIPALGQQETRIYVLLLLVEAIMQDSKHEGFVKLLTDARTALNSPWLASTIDQTAVRAVDSAWQTELDAAFVLANQIGPILAEGTQGNPRQIKRFLNALLLRQTIAKSRGFEGLVNLAAMAKLMLAERFQTDLYEHIAKTAMGSSDGKVAELAALEAAVKETPKRKTKKAKDEKETKTSDSPWLEREGICEWLQIEPALGDLDLRPHVFVARDRRMTALGSGSDAISSLTEQLATGGQMVVRGAEQTVKALVDGDARTIFAALREKILQLNNYSSMPDVIHGFRVLVKHHPQLQVELMSLMASLDTNTMGVWAASGWNECLTETAAKQQLNEMLRTWSSQTDNASLKRVAGQALSTGRKG